MTDDQTHLITRGKRERAISKSVVRKISQIRGTVSRGKDARYIFKFEHDLRLYRESLPVPTKEFSRYSSFTEKGVCKASWKSKNRCLSYIVTCRKKYAVESVVFRVTKLINSFRSNLWLFLLILLLKRKRLSRWYASSILTLFPFISRTFLASSLDHYSFLSFAFYNIYLLVINITLRRYTLLWFRHWMGPSRNNRWVVHFSGSLFEPEFEPCRTNIELLEGRLFDSITSNVDPSQQIYLRLLVTPCDGLYATKAKICDEREFEVCLEKRVWKERQGSSVSSNVRKHPPAWHRCSLALMPLSSFLLFSQRHRRLRPAGLREARFKFLECSL